jgi:hypothetical protein
VSVSVREFSLYEFRNHIPVFVGDIDKAPGNGIVPVGIGRYVPQIVCLRRSDGVDDVGGLELDHGMVRHVLGVTTFVLGAKEKTEMHIFAGPHDVIGSPGIVEEVAVNAGGKIRLAVRKAQGRLNTQRHERCVQGFD